MAYVLHTIASWHNCPRLWDTNALMMKAVLRHDAIQNEKAMMPLSMFSYIRLRTTETVWPEEASSHSSCTGSSRCAQSDVATVQRIGVIFRCAFSAVAR